MHGCSLSTGHPAEGDCSEVCGSAGEKTIEGLLHGCINPLIVMDLYKHM